MSCGAGGSARTPRAIRRAAGGSAGTLRTIRREALGSAGTPRAIRREAGGSAGTPRTIRREALGAALLVALVAIGCTLEPVDRTIEGRLDEDDARHPVDGSFYDEHRFDADRGWRVVVEMRSEELDPFLQLRLVGSGDGDFLRQNDDVDETTTTARISLRAPRRGTYVVWANSHQPGQIGAYTLTIRAEKE
ncbi:MAG: hypothetical protein KF901_26765 [Myxococcales bacterium]|nr:hypothetical protein [Myxococcales bacterium]